MRHATAESDFAPFLAFAREAWIGGIAIALDGALPVFREDVAEGLGTSTRRPMKDGVAARPSAGPQIAEFRAAVPWREVFDRIGGAGLTIELPGGARLLVQSPVQLQMAAELLRMMASSGPIGC
jgi:hypothetical protein